MLNSQAAMLGSSNSISVSFNYISPKHFDSLFLSPKQSHIQNSRHHVAFPLQVNTNFINTRNHCVRPDLDTTLELKTRPSMEQKIENRLKKPLCQSVIIKNQTDELESSNEINFRQRFSNNHLSPTYRNNITSSCILSDNFQSGANKNPFSSSLFDKQNFGQLKQSHCETAKKPFCFNKSKIKVKKREIKLSKAKIQDFHLGEMVGKGSIGRVYVVMHKQTGFYYALKKIVKAYVKDLKQFSLGIKSHILFHHPHIAQLYACFNDQEHIYLLMELCTDSNLAKYKKKIKADEEKDKLICGIARGVQYMHHNQLRHGDIKLENILVTYGFPKLTDFDCLSKTLSPSFQEIRRKTQLWGSPAYFSPDMIQKCSFSMSDDIWSLGVIAYEIYCGSHPFDLKGSEDLNKIVQKEINPMLKSVKESTRAMICKMLEKSGKKRANLLQIIEYFGMSGV